MAEATYDKKNIFEDKNFPHQEHLNMDEGSIH